MPTDLKELFRDETAERIADQYIQRGIDRAALHAEVLSFTTYSGVGNEHHRDGCIDRTFNALSKVPTPQLLGLLAEPPLSFRTIATKHHSLFAGMGIFDVRLMNTLANNRFKNKAWAKRDITELTVKDFEAMQSDVADWLIFQKRPTSPERIGPISLLTMVTSKIVIPKIKKPISSRPTLDGDIRKVVEAFADNKVLCAKVESLLGRPGFKPRLIGLIVEEYAKK